MQTFGVAIGSAVLTAAVVALGASAAPQQGATTQAKSDAPSGDEAAVRQLAVDVGKAYNKADAKAIGELFDDDAALIDHEGNEVRGREAIEAHYTQAFGEGPTARVRGEFESVRLITPDVARINGHFQLIDEDGTELAAGRYAMLASRRDGRWRLEELRDYSVQVSEPPSNAEHLSELEWMVGDWVDEGPDAKVHSNMRWDENQNFLIRTYTVQVEGGPATGGTQWIGWDPQAEQIRSWVFDREGGYGQGTWSQVADDQWVVKASGVLRDGRSTSSTQTIQKVNDDVLRFRSLDRLVGDEVMPDVSEVLMVRRPPAPGGGGATPPPGGSEPAGKAAEKPAEKPVTKSIQPAPKRP
jgi:uncharacterized protein (TIGR02246 family)